MSIKRYITTILFACMAMALTFAFNGKISFAKDKTICIEAGDTVKLPLKNAKSYKYRCNKKSVVKIKNGKITALKKGKCKVTVVKGKKTKTYVIKVKETVSEETSKTATSSDNVVAASPAPNYVSATESPEQKSEREKYSGGTYDGGGYYGFTGVIYDIQYFKNDKGRDCMKVIFLNNPDIRLDAFDKVLSYEYRDKKYIIATTSCSYHNDFKICDKFNVSALLDMKDPSCYYGEDYVEIFVTAWRRVE